MKKYAFTLAEVLITLGIIGVVAAITLPALITNIQDRVKEKRVQNIQQKFSKATDKMLSISGLNGYDSTLDFVNELKNHLSIAKVCENDELRNCWPTEKVTLDDGKEWNIADTKTGKTLKMKNDDSHEWSDTVGLITGDGTAMILSYNTKCDIEPTTTSNWTSDKSSSTNCIAAVFDWNGSSKPNQFGTPRADVLALNATGLGNACAVKINNSCFGALKPTSDSLTKAECDLVKDELGIKYCRDYNSGKGDYWAWAVKQCGGVDKMASLVDLAAIATQIYGTKIYTSDNGLGVDNITYNTAIASSLGFPSTVPFMVWSGEERDSIYAHTRHFKENLTSSYYGTDRDRENGVYLCKFD